MTTSRRRPIRTDNPTSQPRRSASRPRSRTSARRQGLNQALSWYIRMPWGLNSLIRRSVALHRNRGVDRPRSRSGSPQSWRAPLKAPSDGHAASTGAAEAHPLGLQLRVEVIRNGHRQFHDRRLAILGPQGQEPLGPVVLNGGRLEVIELGGNCDRYPNETPSGLEFHLVTGGWNGQHLGAEARSAAVAVVRAYEECAFHAVHDILDSPESHGGVGMGRLSSRRL